MTREFRWLSAGPLPAACDLRAVGWILRAAGAWIEDPALPVLLALPDCLTLPDWLALTCGPLEWRARTILVGLVSAQERAGMLRRGFGDALPACLEPVELAARAERLLARRPGETLRRQAGSLRLELVARQAFLHDRSVGLHPREFALLWRLAETPGAPVAPDVLLRDVWRLSFRPETNTLAVHVSRMRAKLRAFGIEGLVETLPRGAYRVMAGPKQPDPVEIAIGDNLALDAYVRLGEHGGNANNGIEHADGIEA